MDGWSADHGKKIKLYLDVDMVASPNGGYFVHGGKGSDEEEAGPAGSATIALVVADQLTKTGVAGVHRVRPGRRSPFVEAGIPVGDA